MIKSTLRKTTVWLLVAAFAMVLGTEWLLNVAPHESVKAATTTEAKAISDFSSAFKQVAKTTRPFVVNITTATRARVPSGPSTRTPQLEQFPFRDFFGDDLFDRFFRQPTPGERFEGYEQRGLGTGVIVTGDGYILSNNHVVAGAEEITVKLEDGKTHPAKLVGTDEKSDLAVLKIDLENLVPAKLGDSDHVEVGEWVVAVGNPFGLDQTVTAGIVSAKGRADVGIADYEDFIQTDAAINPGNSGGPLVNLKGEVIGINTAIANRNGGYIGIGFAIPTSMAQSIMDSLIRHGKVTRGWLGVGIQDLSEDLASSFKFHGTDGALVSDLTENSPAKEAGIQPGDVIVSFQGKKVKTANELRNAVAATAPGASAAVDLYRQGKKLQLKVKLAERSGGTLVGTPAALSGELGMSVQALTPGLAQQIGVDEGTQGVVVTRVEPGSVADSAGIRPGDIITSLGGLEIEGLSQFNKAMAGLDLKKGFRLQVFREGFKRFVFLKRR